MISGTLITTPCSRCKRRLRDPESVRLGIGPVCRTKVQPDGDRGTESGPTRATLPFDPRTGDIVCLRPEEAHGRCDTSSRVQANIDQTVIHHSPDGFNWGYGGSGPADFALNILNHFMPVGRDGEPGVKCYQGYCSRFAWDHHQDFKYEFVAAMPLKGGTIPGATIREWILRRSSGTRPL